MPILPYYSGELGRLYDAASDKAQQAVSAVAGTTREAIDSARRTAGDLVDAGRRQAEELARAAREKAAELAQATRDTAEAVKQAAVDTVQAGQAMAQQAAQVAAQKARELQQGAKQAFNAGVKKAAELRCKAQGLKFNARYMAYNNKQVRICTDENGQTVEEVERGADGRYYTTGKVTSPVGDVWQVERYPQPRLVEDRNFPRMTHVNGINVKPAGGLQDARLLQETIHNRCGGALEGAGGGGGPCESCGDCILYTYSANTGTLNDLEQCVAAKAGWDGAVTQTQAQTMRDAIERGDHITVSAHSRGSILTDNSWKLVFGEYTDRYYGEAYNSPEALRAAESARQTALNRERPTISPDAAANMARQQTAQRMAEQRAADKINQHVTVVNSGNAVWFPNSRQQGDRVVTSRYGMPTDVITLLSGATSRNHLLLGSPGGALYAAGGGMNTVWVDIDKEEAAADARARRLAQELGEDPNEANADPIAHHTYGHWYVGRVAQRYCDRAKQRAGGG